MNKRSRIILLTAVVVSILVFSGVGVFGRYMPNIFFNASIPSPYAYDENALRLHRSLIVADMHADSIAFGLDFGIEHAIGHISADRIQLGGANLLTMAMPTELPMFYKVFERGAIRGFDAITPSTIFMGWPPRTWVSKYERGLYMLSFLKEIVEKNSDYMFLIETKEDVKSLRDRKERGERVLAIVSAVEGAHILDGDINNFDTLIDYGVRMISLTHHFDNEAGGSSGGWDRYGITDFGREIVAIATERGVVLDLAHASEKLVDDVLAFSDAPMVFSHGGIRGICESDRNVSDRNIRRIAANGGLIGVSLYSEGQCGDDVSSIVESIDYVVKLVGPEYVGLGSDFDGDYSLIIDIAGLPLITQELQKLGYNGSDIEKILGGNYLRVLENVILERVVAPKPAKGSDR